MKIKKRTEKEKALLGRMERKNKIRQALNSIFENNSIDEEDEFTILEDITSIIPKERLIYFLEKIKSERLKEI